MGGGAGIELYTNTIHTNTNHSEDYVFHGKKAKPGVYTIYIKQKWVHLNKKNKPFFNYTLPSGFLAPSPTSKNPNDLSPYQEKKSLSVIVLYNLNDRQVPSGFTVRSPSNPYKEDTELRAIISFRAQHVESLRVLRAHHALKMGPYVS